MQACQQTRAAGGEIGQHTVGVNKLRACLLSIPPQISDT